MSRNKLLGSLLKVTGVLAAIAVVSFAAHQSLRAAKSIRTDSATQSTKVIARIWHGRTLTSKADEYYAYLRVAGIDKIKAIEGNLGAQVFRRTDEATEFTVISYWESREAIHKFAGDDIEKTHFLPKDPQYLLELEPNVKHFEVLLDDRK